MMEDLCKLAGRCGGCFYREESHEEELKIKEELVKRLLLESYEDDFLFEGILESPIVDGYRNKMEYSFGDDRKDGPLTLGLHQKKSFYNVIDADCCRIVHDDFNIIVRETGDYFRNLGLTYVNKHTHTGYLRYLIVRRAVNTGDILVDLVTSSQSPYAGLKELPEKQLSEDDILKEFADRIRALSLTGTVKGILHTVNDTLSDAVRDDGTTVLYGTDFIEEELLGLRFKISPFSFFQTNSKSAEILYKKAREYVSSSLSKDTTVYDLYTGTGTIAQMIAPAVKKVVGIEIVAEAVEAAKTLEADGISARVVNIHTIKPIDKDIILEAAAETGAIVTAEEHNIIGGLGSAVAEVVCEANPVPVVRVGVEDKFGGSGPAVEMLKIYGLCASNIVEKAKKAISMK